MFLSRILAACAAAALFAALPLRAQPVIDLSTLVPGCGDTPFEYTNGQCVADDAKIAALDQKGCTGTGIAWNSDHSKCEAVADAAPSPTCGSALPDLVVKDGKCVVQRQVPRSARGDYEGDCWRMVATPDPNPYGLASGQRYLVLSQKDAGTDKLLTVVPARRSMPYFCTSLGGKSRDVPASEFNHLGSQRLGWTYGMLTLPFKYFPGDKSFTGAGSLGPYVGRRSGAAGSAITFAATVAFGSVKGEVKDAQGNVSSPDLAALSVAAGWMYDISKSSSAKPFKIGLFFGKDFVSASDAVSYAHNRKTWVAFQIGFDFTDN